jgi:hypothetical protein
MAPGGRAINPLPKIWIIDLGIFCKGLPITTPLNMIQPVALWIRYITMRFCSHDALLKTHDIMHD